MTDTTVRRMTTDEIALLRAVVQWRRAEGWTYLPDLNLYAGGPGTPAVAWSTETGEIGMTRKLDRVGYRWTPVNSVTEAVDLLVVFGFLPARFSSAYALGWGACRTFDALPGFGEFVSAEALVPVHNPVY